MAVLSPSASAGLSAFILVCLTTIPSSRSFFHKAKRKPKDSEHEETSNVYEDLDGVATEESQRAYSTALPTYISISGTFIGLLASTAKASLASVHRTNDVDVEDWLVFATWVCQSLSVIEE